MLGTQFSPPSGADGLLIYPLGGTVPAGPHFLHVQEDTLAGVTLTRSGRQGEEGQRLKAYLASLRAPNRYGYLPIGLEWDLW